MGSLRVTCMIATLLSGSVATCAHGADAPAASAKDVKAQLNELLFDAAREGRIEMLREFAQARYDINIRTVQGYTALILATYHGHAAAVDFLIQAGADACAKDNRGNTALMGAIFKGEVAIASKLLAADCNPDQKNLAGQTPAMYAALFGRVDLLNDLATRGADLEATDVNGNSANSLARGEIRIESQR